MLGITVAIALGQQDLDRLALDLRAVIAEEYLSSPVHQRNLPGPAANHDGVRHGFQQITEPAPRQTQRTQWMALLGVQLGGGVEG